MMSDAPFASPFERELLFAREMAEKAGVIALEYYRTNDLKAVMKADKTPVTVADQTINTMFIEMIQRNFPQDGVLGEEESWQPERRRKWVCDPIDGTASFIVRDRSFMVSVALVDDGRPIVAATANPVGDAEGVDIYWAAAGAGAYKNGRAIRVSDRPLPEARLAFPTNLETLLASGELFKRLKDRAGQTSILNGSVFKGMRIAEGLLDGAVWPPSQSLHPWDMAAVKLIVEEAGGRFSDARGGDQRFDAEMAGGAIVSNSIIHQQLLSYIE